jgi:hypothetical protein
LIEKRAPRAPLVVVVPVRLRLAESRFEGVEVEVELATSVGEVEFIETPAGTIARSKGFPLEVSVTFVTAVRILHRYFRIEEIASRVLSYI